MHTRPTAIIIYYFPVLFVWVLYNIYIYIMRLIMCAGNIGKCSSVILLLLLLSSLQYYIIIIIDVFGCDIINIGRRRPHLVYINSRLYRNPMSSIACTHTYTQTHSYILYNIYTFNARIAFHWVRSYYIILLWQNTQNVHY